MKRTIVIISVIGAISLILAGLSFYALTNFENNIVKTVYFPNDIGYDKEIFSQVDWGWNTASDEEKKNTNTLIDKIMNENRLPVQSIMYLMDEGFVLVTIHPEIQKELSNDQIEDILQEHTLHLPVFVEFNILEEH